MASEVSFDLRNEHRNLDYLCVSVYTISMTLESLFSQGRKQNSLVDLHASTSPQIKMF